MKGAAPGAGRPSKGSGRILVVTSVHQADDPRIRHRTAGVLAPLAPVRYASKPPPPANRDDLEWVPLEGNRPRRALAAFRQLLRRDLAVASVHDPELLPFALFARLLRRVPVVFDLHEDLPAQIRTKEWLPRPLRAPVAGLAQGLLRLAERFVVITLAEASYRTRFRRAHPVLPNYPIVEHLGSPADSDGAIVYVGDVTELRGASMLVRLAAQLGRPLVLIGRCAEPLGSRLRALAVDAGVSLDLPGFVPHAQAMARLARGGVGVSPLADVPNYHRSLPTKVLEYLALGIPVVASDLPGTRDVIGGLPGVQLVPARDEVAWADALVRALDDPAERAAARAAAAQVRVAYRWPAEELRRIYAAAAGRRWQHEGREGHDA